MDNLSTPTALPGEQDTPNNILTQCIAITDRAAEREGYKVPEGIEDRENQILDILQTAFLDSALGGAQETARLIDENCPSLDQEKQVRDYVYCVWETIGTIASSPEVTVDVHIRLIEVVQCLARIARGATDIWEVEKRLWADLPDWADTLDTFNNDPTINPETLNDKRATIWRNSSAFSARCLNCGILGPYIQLMEAMDVALEGTEPITDSRAMGLRIEVASIWIGHSSQILLRWAQENIGYTDGLVDDPTQHLPGGPLYDGPPCMCFRRWGFWISRFEELSKDGSVLSDNGREIAKQAAESMKQAENNFGNRLG